MILKFVWIKFHLDSLFGSVSEYSSEGVLSYFGRYFRIFMENSSELFEWSSKDDFEDSSE
jgi:hypothetical protein